MPDNKRTATGVLGGVLGLVGLSALAGVLVTATVTPAVAVSSAAASSAISMFDNLPSVLTIDKLSLPSEMLYKNADGKWAQLAKFYDQDRSPVAWNQIAPVMYDAILSSEDARFYEHGGIDLIGTTSALLANLKGTSSRGGSSISQQYVKNVLIQRCEWSASGNSVDAANKCWDEAAGASGTQGIQRKIQEMRYAVALEQKYSKNDILLGYLNIALFGGTTYGIDAAARYYFGVPASKLNLSQAATLAGMVQNPNTYRIDLKGGSTTQLVDGKKVAVNGEKDGYKLTKQRQEYVLGRMYHYGKITKAQYDEAMKAPITPKITPSTTGCASSIAPYFCQYVYDTVKSDAAFGASSDDRLKALQKGGLKIYTTLDARLQEAADKTMSTYAPATVNSPTWKYGSTIVNIQNSTGRLLSIAQNTKFGTPTAADPGQSQIIYAGDRQRGGSGGFAPGSTFKIFTILDWLEQGHSLNERLNGNIRVIKRLTNSCTGDWVNTSGAKVGNFGNERGYYGTPLQFTAQSLNSGFFAMAEKLDMCDIGKDAAKLGVSNADGSAVDMRYQTSIIGNTQAVSPIAMGGAFAAVANAGIYCQPKVIDRVTDSNGKDLPIPKTTCQQQVQPNVAATAAYDLQGVMHGSGTAARANPYDGTPTMGKTGTNEATQTWLIQASTAVTSVVWSGVADGLTLSSGGPNKAADVFRTRSSSWMALSDIRYYMSRDIQRVADQYYPGSAFPAPDPNLNRQVLVNLPNVVGMPQDQATQTLQDAGFDVQVGPAVAGTQPAGTIAQQNPGPGQIAGGTTVTISPSDGKGITIPDVTGQSPQEAAAALRGAGFSNLSAKCTQQAGAGGKVTGTSPAANTIASPDTAITIQYAADQCGGGGGGGGKP